VFEVVRKYRVEDIAFQDENFFANQQRVLDFCSGIREHGMTFSWSATSRADQIATLDDDLLSHISAANLRKVIIGAESGSQEMLNLMKKDTLAEEAVLSAEKLHKHHIGASFNFIVGFPEETFSETQKTLSVVKEIKRISNSFEFNIFFFTPYPGTDLFFYMKNKGYTLPKTLAEWSDIDFILYSGYWIRKKERDYVERFKFYTKLATESMQKEVWAKPLRWIANMRTQHDYYSFPIEKSMTNFVRHRIFHKVNW
jgi:anaerobic magnesium-protoporphyrin IX monomethyl ester cyclase